MQLQIEFSFVTYISMSGLLCVFFNYFSCKKYFLVFFSLSHSWKSQIEKRSINHLQLKEKHRIHLKWFKLIILETADKKSLISLKYLSHLNIAIHQITNLEEYSSFYAIFFLCFVRLLQWHCRMFSETVYGLVFDKKSGRRVDLNKWISIGFSIFHASRTNNMKKVSTCKFAKLDFFCCTVNTTITFDLELKKKHIGINKMHVA